MAVRPWIVLLVLIWAMGATADAPVPKKKSGKLSNALKNKVKPQKDLLRATLIAPGTVTIGKAFPLKIRVTHPRGYRVFLDHSLNLAPLQVVGMDRSKPVVKRGQITEDFVYRCFANRLGDIRVKRIEVPYTTDKQEPRIKELSYKVTVQGTMGNAIKTDLRPAGKIQPVWVPNRPLRIGLIVGGAALLAALLGAIGFAYYRKWREAHRPPPPPVPAHITALERLKKLEEKYPPKPENAKVIAFETSEVVRWYLGRMLGFAGAEMTTSEVLDNIKGKDMGRVTPIQVENFLGMTDLVKFADFVPNPTEIAGWIRTAREIVTKVQERYEISQSSDTTA